MRVSFVIPAHNEAKLIGRTLDAIARVAGELKLNHEVIVADDASTDATAAIAQERGALVVSHDRRQIAATRNLGARHATGGVLIFVDADTMVTHAAVRQALEAIDHGAIGGGAMIRFDGRVPLYARLLTSVFMLVFRILRYTGGCFLFCTREAFDKAGGWDETHYAGEEIRLAQALKKHGRFVIVRDRVITSGRKLRTYSAFEVLGQLLKISLSPEKSVKQREGLGLWYEARREDPHTHD